MTPQQTTIVRTVIDYSGAAAFMISYFVTRDFPTATWCLVVVSALALALGLIVLRKITPLPLIFGGAALIFGTLTLAFHDSRILKMKTTFIDLGLGAAMLIGLMLGKSPIKLLIGESLKLSDTGWKKLTLRFGLFFLFMALLNEVVWRTQSEAVWVLFRMPGQLILSFLFSFTQMPMMMKDAKAMEAAGHVLDTQQ